LAKQYRTWNQKGQKDNYLATYEVGKVELNTMINVQVRFLRLELQAERYLFQVDQKQN
jgi:hypothetical protein